MKQLWIASVHIFVWIIVALSLFGCGGPMLFAKPGGDSAQLEHDSYDCEQEWERSSKAIAYRLDPLGNLWVLSFVRSDMEACMKQKGWTRTNG